jgi:hypothetical protein
MNIKTLTGAELSSALRVKHGCNIRASAEKYHPASLHHPSHSDVQKAPVFTG